MRGRNYTRKAEVKDQENERSSSKVMEEIEEISWFAVHRWLNWKKEGRREREVMIYWEDIKRVHAQSILKFFSKRRLHLRRTTLEQEL